MEHDQLWQLVQIAADIVELEHQGKPTRLQNAVERFGRLRNTYAADLLAWEESGGDAVNRAQRELNELREHADPSWSPALDYTTDNLLAYLDKEASRSPGMRTVRRAAPFVAAAIAAVAYFGIALFNATPVTAEVGTREGLRQRAAAAEKVIRYDDWMGTHVRRGGWVKGLLFWPIKPSDSEISGAAEFVSLVVAGQGYANGCGSVVGSGQNISNEQIKMISEVADYIQRSDIAWQDPAPLTVVTALEQATRC